MPCHSAGKHSTINIAMNNAICPDPRVSLVVMVAGGTMTTWNRWIRAITFSIVHHFGNPGTPAGRSQKDLQASAVK